MKKSVSIFTVIILLLFFQNQLFAQRKYQIHKVVIDAGHGGHDNGAQGRNSKEKDITLAIALKAGKLIQKNCPDIQVIYTRESDVFVELFRRAQIANENKADLFISIHCNANSSPLAYGSETYVMGLHKSEANLDVARNENASILLEDNYSKRYDGFNPNSPEAYIIFNLFQNAFLDRSLDFASRVEDNFTANTRLQERGVKQAGFLVLYKTTMPGVLVETGFLSNSREEAYLMSEEGQDLIAFSIFRSFDQFRIASNGRAPVTANRVEDSLNKQNPTINKLEKDKIEQALKADTFGYRNAKKIEPEPVSKTKTSNEKAKVSPPVQKVSTPVQKVSPPVQKETIDLKAGKPVNDAVKPVVTIPSNTGLKFRVQFMTNPKNMPLDTPVFKDIPNVKMYIQDQLFKYTAGDEPTPIDAEHIKQLVVGKGYRDAFVLPFLNENRITMKEALIMIKNKQ